MYFLGGVHIFFDLICFYKPGIDLQTSVRGQNGLEFYQESSGHGPRHVTHLLALLLAELANERLKILTSC